MFRAGEFNNPKNDDPKFEHQHQAELWCEQQSKAHQGAYAVWNRMDETLFLFYEYEAFVPRR